MPFLSAPHPAWPSHFDEVRGQLAEALAAWQPHLEHIGSTSVPDLAAKPLIDVLAGVAADAVDAPELRSAFEGLGYRQASHQPSLGRRIFIRRGGSPQVNVHLVPYEGEAWTQLLVTRDLLREDPEVAASYVAMKKAADAESGGNYRTYRARKVAWFDELAPRLEEFHRARSGGAQISVAALNAGVGYSPEILTPVSDPTPGMRDPLEGEPGSQTNPILGPGCVLRAERGVNDGWITDEDGGMIQMFRAPDGTYRVDVVSSASPSPR